LGFRKKIYTNNNFYISESILNVIGDNYLFLKINNYGNIFHTKGYYKYISKIILDNNKNSICFGVNNNTFKFKKPKKIKNLSFEIVDKFGYKVSLNKINFSFTLLFEYL
jgi:hypothetical protein